MRSISVALALVFVAGSSANAERPIVVRAGVGITLDFSDGIGPGFHTDLAYRVIDELAVGVHAGITRYSDTINVGNMPGSPTTAHEVYMSLQLGVGAHWSRNGFWLAPWVGVIDQGLPSGDYTGSSRKLALGLGAGADLYITPTGHRVGAYLDVAYGRGKASEYSSAVSSDLFIAAGVAYRFW
jgi:hypothetical protein